MAEKRIVNIDILAQGWMQAFPTLYYAVLNGEAHRLHEEIEFFYRGKPKSIHTLVDNISRIVGDERWQWPSDRVPYDILITIPNDRVWIGIVDCGPQWKNKRRVDDILRQEQMLKGKITKLLLRPSFEHSGIDEYGYVDVQPHVVLAFDDEDDLIYWRLKYE